MAAVLAAGLFAPPGAPPAPASAGWFAAAGALALAVYVWAGLWLRGTRLPALVGSFSGFDVLYGALAAGALLAGWWAAEVAVPGLAAAKPNAVGPWAPWIAISAVVAGSEELVYRGYLQRQFEALGRGFAPAAAAQAVLFGVAHLGQGVPAAIGVGVCGLILSLLVRARRGLPAAIVAHFLFDAAAPLWS